MPKPKTIMVIDDSRFDQIIISRTVEYTNLFEKLHVFSGGQDALDFLQENINQPDKLPQLVLLDIQMPHMDGFEFMENFKTLPSAIIENCRVAILSSTDDLADISKAESDEHIIKLLKKPLHPNCLKQLLSEFYFSE